MPIVKDMNSKKLLMRITDGHTSNVRFSVFSRLLTDLGFQLDRVRGSHHIYILPGHPARMNIQNVNGQAKSYQVGQLLPIIEEYNLGLKERS